MRRLLWALPVVLLAAALQQTTIRNKLRTSSPDADSLQVIGGAEFGSVQVIGGATDSLQVIGGAEIGGNVTVEGDVAVAGRISGVGTIPQGTLLFFPALNTCPPAWTRYAAVEGRMIVGLQAGGSVGATSGPALTDQELRRGGTAHSGPSLSNSLSLNDNLGVSHTNPSVNHQHNHSYDRPRIANRFTPDVSGQEGAWAKEGATTAGQSSGPSVSGGGASITGGVSLGGSVTVSGGSASDQPQPAPYIQLLGCISP